MQKLSPYNLLKYEFTNEIFHLKKIKFITKLWLKKGCLDPTQTRRPKNLPLFPTRFQPEPTLSSVGDGFSCPRPHTGGSSGGFSSPKLEPPDPTVDIYKSGQLRQDQAQIRGDPVR